MDFTPKHPVPDFPHKQETAPNEQPFLPHNPPLAGASAPKKPAWRRMALIGGGVVVIAALLAAVLYARHDYPKTTYTTTRSSSPSPAANPVSSSNSATPASATDNASLQKDLNGINGSLNSSSKSQSDADSGLGDSSSQIDVPTN